MKKVSERQLMRLLHGELPAAEAARLEAELERDGALRSSYERLARVWDGLELPASAAPAGLAAQLTAAARRLREGDLSWSLAPAWARGGAAAALAAGLLLGAAFAGGFEAPGGGEAVLVADADADALPLSLAEVYWLSLEDSGGLLAEDRDAEGAR